MDAPDFAIFYPRLAADLRRIEVEEMPGWVDTPYGLHLAGHVLPEVAFATVLFTAVTVWLVIGVTRWDWAAWLWVPATVCGLLVLRGARRIVRCARIQFTYWRAGRR
ncbi:hypothetical protein [Kutzneria sp. 744]|uniref:hypothetical protein n=1 Tax=Kutzneria sp. (strain 744) TaxID=345341 RepID=UPI0003EEB8E6|nr:hypothetical protein [Kutzneria sp. 744]EWM12019.1 hypothetical protein KUTG_02323 [Kutzneria sp. 744]